MRNQTPLIGGMMTSTSVGNPLVFTSQPDLATGQAVYALLPEPALPENVRPTTRDLTLVEHGKIAGVAESGTSPIHVSRLPEERMAAATWEDIERALRDAEDGSHGAVDVELRPGGELVVTDRKKSAQLLSQLPKGRMACVSLV
jgi:hypothetical protein